MNRLVMLGVLTLLSACGGYDPCARKKCGDHCNPCEPDSSFCINFSTTQCQKNGDCTKAIPVCN